MGPCAHKAPCSPLNGLRTHKAAASREHWAWSPQRTSLPCQPKPESEGEWFLASWVCPSHSPWCPVHATAQLSAQLGPAFTSCLSGGSPADPTMNSVHIPTESNPHPKPYSWELGTFPHPTLVPANHLALCQASVLWEDGPKPRGGSLGSAVDSKALQEGEKGQGGGAKQGPHVHAAPALALKGLHRGPPVSSVDARDPEGTRAHRPCPPPHAQDVGSHPTITGSPELEARLGAISRAPQSCPGPPGLAQ